MKYQIEFPNAEKMVEYERAERPVPPYCYDSNESIVEEIKNRIDRQDWLDSHQPAVDLLLSLVRSLSNIPEWQYHALYEAACQIAERNFHPQAN